MLSLLDNVLIQGLSYGCAVLGVAMAFRILRYPDLTPDGSFILGATITAACTAAQVPVSLGMAVAILGGVAAGAVTGLLNAYLRVNRLLSGILTSMACYSLGFRVLGGRSNVGFLDRRTLLSGAERLDASAAIQGLHAHPAVAGLLIMVVAVVVLGTLLLLKSNVGLVMQAVGANEPLARDLGRQPTAYRVLGLGVANGLVALSGVLVASAQGFADVNMGAGIIVVLIAALVLGEEGLRVMRVDPSRRLEIRLLAPVIGSLLYYLLFLVMLRASTRGWLPFRLEPTDLKALSATLVVVVYALRIRRSSSEELLPL